MEAFKDRLHALKAGRKMTTKEIAKLCGVAPVTVSKWLEGPRMPRTRHLHALSSVFSVPVQYLETGEKDGDHIRAEQSLFRALPHLTTEQIAMLAKHAELFWRMNVAKK